MTWVKVDDQFQDHPSMVGLSMAAIGLWTCGLAYCSRYLTDGQIPKKALFRVCPQPDAETIAGELIEAGRWVDRGTAFAVANYLEWNPSRHRVEEIRAARSEAGAAGGRAKAQAGADAKQSASDLPGTSADAAMPPSHPLPIPREDISAPRRGPFEADFETWYDAFPRKRERDKAKQTYVARRRAGVTAEDLLTAVERYAEAGRAEGRPIEKTKYPATFLNNGWEDWLPGGAAEEEAKSQSSSVAEARARLAAGQSESPTAAARARLAAQEARR